MPRSRGGGVAQELNHPRYWQGHQGAHDTTPASRLPLQPPAAPAQPPQWDAQPGRQPWLAHARMKEKGTAHTCEAAACQSGTSPALFTLHGFLCSPLRPPSGPSPPRAPWSSCLPLACRLPTHLRGCPRTRRHQPRAPSWNQRRPCRTPEGARVRGQGGQLHGRGAMGWAPGSRTHSQSGGPRHCRLHACTPCPAGPARRMQRTWNSACTTWMASMVMVPLVPATSANTSAAASPGGGDTTKEARGQSEAELWDSR